MTWPLRYAALALVAASSVSPQQAVRPAEPGVRFTPDLVQVDAVVTDAKGKQVTSLRPEDFEITEDGKHQTITDFAYSAAGPATPRTVVFIADTCDTSVYDRSIQTALEGFIRNHMRPGDRVSVLESLGGEGRSQQLTGDSEAAAAAAEAVGRRFVPGTPSLCREVALWFEYGQARERESAARSDSEARYHGVASFNAVVSAVEGLAGTPGQKHVVLLSELMGWTRYSRTTPAVQGLANRANRAGVVLHFVDLSGFRAPPRIVGQSRWTSSSARPRSGAAEDAAAVRNPPGVTVTTVTAPQARGKAASYLSAVTGGIISQTVFDRPVPDVATWRREVDASRAEFLKMSLDRIAANTEGHNWIGYRPPQRDVRKADRNFHQIKVTVRRRGLTVRSRGGYQGALDHSPPAAPRSREELLR
ncbi:MAG TPA: VWA domain-containing protein, partial [Bryobacteraceae bacterium]|nr:VWA domain-containing protein [Bryobacteraceae bacterium]